MEVCGLMKHCKPILITITPYKKHQTVSEAWFQVFEKCLLKAKCWKYWFYFINRSSTRTTWLKTISTLWYKWIFKLIPILNYGRPTIESQCDCNFKWNWNTQTSTLFSATDNSINDSPNKRTTHNNYDTNNFAPKHKYSFSEALDVEPKYILFQYSKLYKLFIIS